MKFDPAKFVDRFIPVDADKLSDAAIEEAFSRTREELTDHFLWLRCGDIEHRWEDTYVTRFMDETAFFEDVLSWLSQCEMTNEF